MSLNKYPHNGEPPSSSPHDPDITFTEGISAISIQSPTPYSYIPSLQATPLPSYESVRRPSGNSSSHTVSQDLNSDLCFALPGRLEHENISGDVFQTSSIDKGLPGQIITATQLQQYISSTPFLDSDGPSLAPVQDDSEDYYGTSPLANIANSFARLDQKKDLQPASVSDDTLNMLQQTLHSPERYIFVKRELKIEASEEFMECADLSQLQSPEPQQSMSNLQATPRVQKRRVNPSHTSNENSTMLQVLRNFNFSVPVDSSTVNTTNSQQQKAAKSSSLSLLCGNHRLLSFPERETLDYRDATGAVAALVSPSPLAPLAGDMNRSARGGRPAQLTSLGGPSAEQVAGMAEGDAALPYASGKQLLLSDEGLLCKKSFYQPLGQFSQVVVAGEQSPQVGAYGMSVGQYCTAEQASPGNVASSQSGPTSATQHSSQLQPTQYHPSQTLQQQISPHQAPLQQFSPQQIQQQLSPQQIHHQQNSPQLIIHQQSPQLIHHHQSPQPIHLHQQSPQPIHQQSPQPIQHHHQQSPHQVQHQQISPQHLSPQEYFAHQMQQHRERQQLQQSTQQCMNVAQESAVGSQMKGPRRVQQIAILGEDNSITLSTDHSNHHQLTWTSQPQQEQKPADVKMMDHFVVKIDCSSSAGKRFKACIKSLDMAEEDGCDLDTFYTNHASQSNEEAAEVSITGGELNFGVQDHGNVEGSVLAAAAPLDGERRADGQSLPCSAGSPQLRTAHEGVSSQTAFALSLNNTDLANRNNNNNNNNIVNKIDSYSSTSALAISQTNKPSKAVKRKASSKVRATSDSFLCGVCRAECYTRISLRKHLHECHKERSEAKEVSGLSVCPVVNCRYSTHVRSEFDRHFQKHLVLDGLTPTGKPRSSQTPLLRHRYCKEEIKCPLCSYKCVQMSAFARHIEFHKKKIPIEKYCSCPFCGIDFHEDSEMRAHMNREHKSAEHPENDHWKCMSCTFTSVQEKKLIQHLRMHTGEKPHLCSHCSYRAGRRDNLRSHVRRMHRIKNLYADSFQPAIAHLLEGLDLNDKDANDNSGHENEAISYEDNDQNGDMGANGSRNSSLGDPQPIVGLPSNGQEFEIDSTLANLPYNVLDSFSGTGNSISAVSMDSMMNELMNNSPVVFDNQIMLPAASSYSMWPSGDLPSSSGSRGHADASSMVDAASYGAHATHQVSIQSLATHQINTQPICTQQISSQPVNTQQINIQQINTQQINTQHINIQQINTQPIDTQQINTQQINMQQISAQQINPQQINAQQINMQQINTQQHS